MYAKTASLSRDQLHLATENSEAHAVIARVVVYDSLAAAAPAWQDLAVRASPFPYQALSFLDAWTDTMGVSHGVTPAIFVAEDEAGRPIALLPYGLRRRGGLCCAEYLGGRDSNGHIGLFAPDEAWTRDTVRAFLQEAAALRGIDLFHLTNQRGAWAGRNNPLLFLGGQPSASANHATPLAEDPEAFFRQRLSKHARKRLRHNRTKLANLGPVRHMVACTRSEGSAILDAYFTQKTARLAVLGIDTGCLAPPFRSFLDRVCDPVQPGGAVLELHALLCGDRIVAAFGGIGLGERFSGMLISFDADDAVARCSPGDTLVADVITQKCREGVRSFDLGIGEARYKDLFCSETEVLWDQFIGVTRRGQIAAWMWSVAGRLKRRLKQTSWTWAAVRHGRRLLSRLRTH